MEKSLLGALHTESCSLQPIPLAINKQQKTACLQRSPVRAQDLSPSLERSTTFHNGIVFFHSFIGII